MRRIKFTFLTFIMVLLAVAPAALAVNVQKALSGAANAANATQAASNVPDQEGTQPAPAADATSVSTPVEAYSYNPAGKPDPFRPFIMVETPEAKKQKVVKKEPLSMFPLQRAEAGTYRLVGIAGDEEHRVAIVEDSAKKFYPLLVGTRIGVRNGKVVEIMADRVIVEEYEGKKPKRVILKLRKN